MSRKRFTKVLEKHAEAIDTPLDFCMWALGELSDRQQDWEEQDMHDFAYEAVIMVMRREKDW